MRLFQGGVLRLILKIRRACEAEPSELAGQMPRIRHRNVQAARNGFATKLKDSSAWRTVHQNVSPENVWRDKAKGAGFSFEPQEGRLDDRSRRANDDDTSRPGDDARRAAL
jgi:hypothetical protein